MDVGKIVLGGLGIGVVGGGVAMVVKSRRDAAARKRKLNTPPAEPTVEGAFVEWTRRGYVGRITRGTTASDWLVEIRPKAQGGITQLGAIEPSYTLAAALVHDWTDGVAGLLPKAPQNVGEFVSYGRHGGLQTIAVANVGPDGFTWISALTSDVTANAAEKDLWGALLGAGKFVASGTNPTYKEATAAADASVKSA